MAQPLTVAFDVLSESAPTSAYAQAGLHPAGLRLSGFASSCSIAEQQVAMQFGADRYPAEECAGDGVIFVLI